MNALIKPCFLFFLWGCLFLASCSKNIFRGKSTPHGQYKEGLIQAGLQHTYMGGLWISTGERSLQQPVKINLPYKENGYFAADKPSAIAHIFNLRRGDKLKVTLVTNPATGIKFFIDLWQPGKITANDQPLEVMDSLNKTLQFSADREGDLILRSQVELLKGVEYTLTIITEPSLAYPVQQSGKPRIISLWGVGRDNGTRSHEGIDIAATFRTPALAVANGYITRVDENNLGGKVVFMRPDEKAYSVYYAHLDSQLVQRGQSVKAGDAIGLVGNTGNAKNTVPHLHFGIYTNGGAIDPLAFVDKSRPEPKAISGSNKYFDKWLRTQKNTSLYSSPGNNNIMLQLKTGDVFRILSANANFYKIMLPDGREGYIDNSAVTESLLSKRKITGNKQLLEAPFLNAPVLSTVSVNSEIGVKGMFNNYMLVTIKDKQGWLPANQ